MDIYVGNLSYRATEEDIKELFEAFGEVSRINIISDRETGRSKGFGFVSMESESLAQNAIEDLNGRDFQGRPLVVNEARPRQEQQRRTGGGGGGGGRPQGRGGGGGGGRGRY